MRLMALLSLVLSVALSACQRESSSDAPASAFRARVGGEWYWVQLPITCGLSRFNRDESAQWLFSFEPIDGQGALHLGLAAGDTRPGPRDVLFVLLNHGDASFSQVHESHAELTSMQRTGDGWRVSGRFSLALEGSSMASGRPEVRQIRVEGAEFEGVDCIAPPDPGPAAD